jgi:hypothetical protein
VVDAVVLLEGGDIMSTFFGLHTNLLLVESTNDGANYWLYYTSDELHSIIHPYLPVTLANQRGYHNVLTSGSSARQHEANNGDFWHRERTLINPPSFVASRISNPVRALWILFPPGHVTALDLKLGKRPSGL